MSQTYESFCPPAAKASTVKMVPAAHQDVRPLSSLKRGRLAQVIDVREAGSLGERLLEMGLTPGTLVRLVRCGLWGDPMQLELRGYMLSLRRAQARNIDVIELR